MPLLDVPHIQPHERNKDSVDSFIESKAGYIKRFLNTDRRLIVDMRMVDELCDDDSHCLFAFHNHIRPLNPTLTPATSLSRSSQYEGAVKECLATGANGLCIRILTDEMDDDPAVTVSTLAQTLTNFDVSASEVDLLLDFESVSSSQVATYIKWAKTFLESLPTTSDWRSTSVSGTGMPLNLTSSGIPTESEGEIARTGWTLYRDLLAQLTPGTKTPTFSDYGIDPPDLRDLNFPAMVNVMGPKVKYTLNETWAIHRGKPFKHSPRGYKQYIDIASEIINSGYYEGEDYSWGDKRIKDIAEEYSGTGNATSWIEIGTNHHIRKVVDQVSSLLSI